MGASSAILLGVGNTKPKCREQADMYRRIEFSPRMETNVETIRRYLTAQGERENIGYVVEYALKYFHSNRPNITNEDVIRHAAEYQADLVLYPKQTQKDNREIDQHNLYFDEELAKEETGVLDQLGAYLRTLKLRGTKSKSGWNIRLVIAIALAITANAIGNDTK